MDLDLSRDDSTGTTVVAIDGEIDISTAPQLEDYLAAVIDDTSGDLVLDLCEVGFIDSAGLGVLVGTIKRLRSRHASMQLVCSDDRILKAFRLTGLTQVVGFHATTEQALAATR